MLSNEIATGAIFFIIALLGIVFMYMMAVYVIETVPMWNTALTPLAF